MKKGFLYRLFLARLTPFLARHPGIIMVIAALYILAPFDLLPEAITGLVGYIDDVIAFVITMTVLKKLQDFKKFNFKSPATQPSSQDPYAILGVPQNASSQEIEKAYRKKMAEYHPDKVAHLGDELKQKAHEKSVEIQEAYKALKK